MSTTQTSESVGRGGSPNSARPETVPGHSTRRLHRATLSVVACRPSTHRVGVKGNVRLRARLRLVSERIDSRFQSYHDADRAAAVDKGGTRAGVAARPSIECNTCGREVVRREPGRKICPRCESYWIIVELVAMGRENRQRALPFSASQILFGPRRRRSISEKNSIAKDTSGPAQVSPSGGVLTSGKATSSRRG